MRDLKNLIFFDEVEGMRELHFQQAGKQSPSEK